MRRLFIALAAGSVFLANAPAGSADQCAKRRDGRGADPCPVRPAARPASTLSHHRLAGRRSGAPRDQLRLRTHLLPADGGRLPDVSPAVDVRAAGLNASEQRTVRQMMLPLIPPYTALLTADAVVDGIENEEAYWRGMLAAGERLMRQLGAAAEGIIQQAAGMARDMPSDARRAELLKYLLPLFEIAATEMVIGEDRNEDFEGPGIIGTTMPQHATLRAERVMDGHLFVTGRSHTSAQEIARSMEEALSRLPVTGEGGNTQAGRERLIAQIRLARTERNAAMHYEVSLETGLARRYQA